MIYVNSMGTKVHWSAPDNSNNHVHDYNGIYAFNDADITLFPVKRIEQKCANNYKAAIRNCDMQKELMIMV